MSLPIGSIFKPTLITIAEENQKKGLDKIKKEANLFSNTSPEPTSEKDTEELSPPPPPPPLPDHMEVTQNYPILVRTDRQNPPNVLHIAVAKGDYDAAVNFLKNNLLSINTPDQYGRTPLHRAIRPGSKQLKIVQLLVENGVNLNPQDREGRTPMHRAAFYNSLEIANLLLENKADVNLEDLMGITPIHLAISEGHLEITKLFLAHGANIHAPDNFGTTPFQLSFRARNREIPFLLMQHDEMEIDPLLTSVLLSGGPK
jgi:ankyrin repeat protein